MAEWKELWVSQESEKGYYSKAAQYKGSGKMANKIKIRPIGCAPCEKSSTQELEGCSNNA